MLIIRSISRRTVLCSSFFCNCVKHDARQLAKVCCTAGLLIAAMLAVGGSANSQTIWNNNNATSEWNDALNWSSGLPNPALGSDALFDNTTGTAPQSISVTGATQAARHIAFGSSSGTLSPVAAYTFTDGGSGTINIASGGFLQNFSDSGVVETFNVPYAQAGSSTMNPVGGGFTFNSTYLISGMLAVADISGNGSQPVLFNGTVSGGALNITATNANVTLNGSNDYTGTTTVNSAGGRLHVTNNNSLGTTAGTTIISGGTTTGAVVLDGGTTGITTAEQFSLLPRSGAALGTSQIISASGNNVLNGNFVNSSASGANGLTLTIESQGTGPNDFLTINGNYAHTTTQSPLLTLTGAGSGKWTGNITATSGNFDVVKSGAGTWELSGAANNVDGNYVVHTGILNLTGGNEGRAYTVDAGAKLLVNGTNDTDAAATNSYIVNGTLGGSGSILSSHASSQTNVTVQSGGILAPGNPTGTFTMSLGASGTLDISGAVLGINTQSMLFDLGTVSDKVVLTTGTLKIGTGALEFNDFSFSALTGFGPGTYTLFDTSASINGSLGASLSGLVGGFNATLGLADGGHDLVLTVVPEPGSIMLCLTGVVLCVAPMSRKRSYRKR